MILGALFKLTHLPGANTMLFLGMGTEVLVFFIAGFDRPFDKTEDGKELPTHVKEETEATDEEQQDTFGDETDSEHAATDETPELEGYDGTGESHPHEIPLQGTPLGGTIIIGGASAGVAGAGIQAGQDITVGGAVPQGDVAAQESVDTEAIAAVASSVTTMAGGTIVSPVPQVNPELEEATANYVEELKRLTEMLSKVSEQSERLTRDSEEMENLNRTLTGICKVYEMQLKGASKQIGTIDEINEQTCRMAEQIAELNKIYTRMIEAMTVNMPKVTPQS